MYNPSFKPILVGIAIGLFLITIPFFLIKAALLLLIFAAFFRFVGRRIYWASRRRAAGAEYGYRTQYAGHRGFPNIESFWQPAFADTIRNMSEEEYGALRQKLADESPVDQKVTIAIQ